MRIGDWVDRDESPFGSHLFETGGDAMHEQVARKMLDLAYTVISTPRREEAALRGALDLDMHTAPFDPSTFAQNKERWLLADVARRSGEGIVAQAKTAGLRQFQRIDGLCAPASYRPRCRPTPGSPTFSARQSISQGCMENLPAPRPFPALRPDSLLSAREGCLALHWRRNAA